MKDKPLPQKMPSGHIPVISPILHCLSMPVLVFWRRSFGYDFLSPKSIFLASVVAICQLSYMVWHDESLKPRFYTLSLFFLAVSALYLTHLFCAIYKLKRSTAAHDYYSGSSMLLDFLPASQRASLEPYVRGFAEPAITLIAGFILAPKLLGNILLVAGISLAFKEWIRSWLLLRKNKSMADSIIDAEEMVDLVTPQSDKPVTATGRTGRERYQRQPSSDE
jgi:hypothetical protein